MTPFTLTCHTNSAEISLSVKRQAGKEAQISYIVEDVEGTKIIPLTKFVYLVFFFFFFVIATCLASRAAYPTVNLIAYPCI